MIKFLKEMKILLKNLVLKKKRLKTVKKAKYGDLILEKVAMVDIIK